MSKGVSKKGINKGWFKKGDNLGHPVYGGENTRFQKGHKMIAGSEKGWFVDGHGWKGDNVGYSALHKWISVRLAKPLGCNHCGKIRPLDLANKSHKYKRQLSDWLWLCRKCHGKYDSGKNRKTIRQHFIISKNKFPTVRRIEL